MQTVLTLQIDNKYDVVLSISVSKILFCCNYLLFYSSSLLTSFGQVKPF